MGQAFQWFSEVVTYSRPKMKVCMLGDAQHVEEKIGLENMDVEGLKKLNKNKKLVNIVLCTINLLLLLCRAFLLLCSCKFPTLVTHQESLEVKVNENKAMVKFQLKKLLCMGVAVGKFGMEEKQIFQNVHLSVNFLVSLLKKNWKNVSFLRFILGGFESFIHDFALDNHLTSFYKWEVMTLRKMEEHKASESCELGVKTCTFCIMQRKCSFPSETLFLRFRFNISKYPGFCI
ncbi:hypothetical protein MKX03_003849 [Papaver bracteatum]|nr:hypothetical protein MKX03_003849 [Papaver bracteatum]